jgi:S-adenosylmethionine synthetase
MTAAVYPAEFVFPGHPDKLSDAIADAIVAAAWRREERALVGVEVAVHRDHVYLTGRVACDGAEDIDLEALVRDVYRTAGYDASWRPSPDEVRVVSNVCVGPLEEGEAEFRELADDQAICVGFANDLQATGHLPVEQWLVRRLAQRLHGLRASAPELGLGPDGKVQITVRERAEGWLLESFSCSVQQQIAADAVGLHRAVRVAVAEELQRAAHDLPGLRQELPEHLVVNGAGDFEVGGPEGDNGLSGKKLVMDAYGPRVPIGGGAWSGKDFFKADRAGGLHARRVAKAIVQLGLAREARVVLGWFPGDRRARVLRIEDEAGRLLDADRLGQTFDLSLLRSGTAFGSEALADAARWGHFVDPGRPWERSVAL